MRLTKHRHKTIADINMTPMIDIVFLLIIFFMTVSQVSEVNKERIPLPKQKGSEEQTPATVIVNVDREGQVIVSGKKLSVPQLLDVMGRELRRLDNNPDRLVIVLRGDLRGTATTTTVNEVVKALETLQIKKVKIAVEAPN